jgi:hypothetical protein
VNAIIAGVDAAMSMAEAEAEELETFLVPEEPPPTAAAAPAAAERPASAAVPFLAPRLSVTDIAAAIREVVMRRIKTKNR